MKHTQGEWKLIGISEFSIETDETIVAKLINAGFSKKSTEENLANAKLIAAAPKLLKALQAYVNYMLPSYSPQKWLEQYEKDEKADQVLIQAIKAIKKATE